MHDTLIPASVDIQAGFLKGSASLRKVSTFFFFLSDVVRIFPSSPLRSCAEPEWRALVSHLQAARLSSVLDELILGPGSSLLEEIALPQ